MTIAGWKAEERLSTLVPFRGGRSDSSDDEVMVEIYKLNTLVKRLKLLVLSEWLSKVKKDEKWHAPVQYNALDRRAVQSNRPKHFDLLKNAEYQRKSEKFVEKHKLGDKLTQIETLAMNYLEHFKAKNGYGDEKQLQTQQELEQLQNKWIRFVTNLFNPDCESKLKKIVEGIDELAIEEKKRALEGIRSEVSRVLDEVVVPYDEMLKMLNDSSDAQASSSSAAPSGKRKSTS
jgi:hypothetical protein